MSHISPKNALWATTALAFFSSVSVIIVGCGDSSAPASPSVTVAKVAESPAAANEAAVSIALSEIFKAQIMYQGGGWGDLNKNGVGDFGFFSELSGGPIIGFAGVAGGSEAPKLDFLQPAARWNAPNPIMNGYKFSMYLPDGKGGAYGFQDKQPDGSAVNSDTREKYFIAYACPMDKDSGKNVFATFSGGQSYSVYVTDAADLSGKEPVWNSLFGGKKTNWGDKPVWNSVKIPDGKSADAKVASTGEASRGPAGNRAQAEAGDSVYAIESSIDEMIKKGLGNQLDAAVWRSFPRLPEGKNWNGPGVNRLTYEGILNSHCSKLGNFSGPMQRKLLLLKATLESRGLK